MKVNKLILAVLTALILFSGCKARKVLTTRIDSTAVTQTSKTVAYVETKVDTGKKTAQKYIITTDSNFTTVNITPVAGHVITINKDGSFTGEASNVVVTRRAHINTKQVEKTVDQKGESSTKKVDSLVKTKQETHLQKKIKAVDAKPKPGIWPLVIPIVILGALLILLWWFIGKPRGSK